MRQEITYGYMKWLDDVAIRLKHRFNGLLSQSFARAKYYAYLKTPAFKGPGAAQPRLDRSGTFEPQCAH